MAESAMESFREAECVRWFRGMSKDQIRACNKLLHALRDDMAQGSTYRVHRCISDLGLYPMIASHRIALIMRISHGNDLAFLWFLWEAEYKQANDENQYTVNEQLLLSAIAHLDMPATLRQLEQILPPPSHSKKFQMEDRQRLLTRKQEIDVETLPSRRSSRDPTKYVLPYFEPLMRPKQYVPKKNMRPLEHKLCFPDYSQYKDPMYEIPNEGSRWFSEYQLSPGKRVIKKLLTQELSRLFMHSSAIPLVKDGSLCETHKHLEEQALMKQQELAHETLERCLARWDVAGWEQESRRKRIVQALEAEIRHAAEKYGQYSRRQLTQVVKLSADTDCGLCQQLVTPPLTKRSRPPDLSLLMGSPYDSVGHPVLPDEDPNPLIKVTELSGDRRPFSRFEAGDCKLVKTEDLQAKPPAEPLTTEPKTHKLRRRGKPLLRKSIKAEPPEVLTTQFKNLADLIPRCRRWQKCPRDVYTQVESDSFTKMSRYGVQLDYFKIFHPPALPEPTHLKFEEESGEFPIDLSDKTPLIERCCVDQLQKSLDDKSPEQIGKPLSLALVEAIDKCAVNMFRQELANLETVSEARKKNVVNDDSVLKLTSIDPNDRQLIVELLKAALDLMRANPYFVLATFPNVHKLPILVDWVAARYGKTYSREEMDALVKSSFYIHEKLERNDQSQDPSRILRMQKRKRISYANYARFMCNAMHMKAQYYHQLNQNALMQTRLIWLALRGYSDLGGKIGDTFFAYMPSREMDMKRQNVWQSADHRKMVQIRRKSQRNMEQP